MSQAAEGTSEVVESVQFLLMTDEEVKKHSTIKVTNPALLDVLGIAVPGGLYDPAMGPLGDTSACKTCGERSFYCNGHCGNIELVQPVYNPLLVRMLGRFLKKTCFYCFHFASSSEEVEQCVSKLEFLSRGDVFGAKNVPVVKKKGKNRKKGAKSREKGAYDKDKTGDDKDDGEDSRGSCTSTSSDNKEACWDSSRLTEAMYLLKKFFRREIGKDLTCLNCNESMLKVRNPTFGWFNLEDELPKVVTPLLPSEVRDIVERVWKNQEPLCKYMCSIQQQKFKSREPTGPSMFFLQNIVIMDHPHTVLLVKVLQSNIALKKALDNKAERFKIINCWMELQQSINVLFDSQTGIGRGKKDLNSGICQFLEKKEGIFRQKMMGKRVNFACRSVISPDPYLAVNEIGIPPCFALRLTYPERVTPWNAEKLRVAVINGPEDHPGATTYVDSVVTMKLPLNKKQCVAISRKLPSSRGIASQPENANKLEIEGKTVHRHLQDGDIVLVNRQVHPVVQSIYEIHILSLVLEAMCFSFFW